MTARKSLLLFVVSMFGSVLGFLSTVVIARWMGPEALGTIGYLLGLLGLLSIVLDLGFAQAHLTRVAASDKDPAPLIGTLLLIKGLLCVPFLFLVVILPWLKPDLGQALIHHHQARQAYYILALFYAVHSIANVLLHTFEGRLETAKETIPDVGGSLLSFVAKAAVAFLGLGTVALSGAYLVEPVVRLLLGGLLFRGYSIGRATREHLTSYVRYAVPLMLNSAVSMVVTNLNPVVIGVFWSAADVGYYTAVLGFSLVIDRVASAVAVPFLPRVSGDVARGSWEEMRNRTYVAERYLLLVLAPVATLLLFFSREIVELTLGAGFGPSAAILVALILSSVAAAAFIPYRMVLYAVERQRDLVVSSCVGLVILVLADALLIPVQLGSLPLPGLRGLGAALGMLLMNLGSGLVQFGAARRCAGIAFYKRSSLILLAAAAMYLTMGTVRALVPVALVLRVLLCSLVGAMSYLLTLVLMREFTRADAQVFLNILHPQQMFDYVSEELGSNRPGSKGDDS